ncbi:type II toxin-antitoxin system HicB family antitoxin [Salmonella enterica]|nr:type II toxin-antitoxin system HicB family antitoxin [Salmonella enterica]
MKILKYNGYLGTIEPDIENNIFYGKLAFISDLVTYEATTLAELEQEFKTSVDLYLQACTEDGRSSDAPFSCWNMP